VVRRAEWPLPDKLTERSRSGDRCHDRRDPSFLVGQRRQQVRHCAGQKRLARTWGPDHHHAVSAGQSHLQGTTRFQLAANLGQVWTALEVSVLPGPRRRGVGVPADAVGQFHARGAALRTPPPAGAEERCRLGQGFCRQDFDSPGQVRFFCPFSRHYDSTDSFARQGCDHRQHPRHRPQIAPE